MSDHASNLQDQLRLCNLEKPEKKDEDTIPHFTEFECKYRVDGIQLYEWKKIMKEQAEAQEDYKGFVYLESDDIYYTKGEEFLRYRFSDEKKVKRAELTYKSKTGEANNIIRKEVNLRVDGNDKDTVEALCNCLGFKKNFTISKLVHIYNFGDATLPFYSVTDESGKQEHFMEIEVDEKLIPSLTEDEAWDIIKKWEIILAPLGITARNRLRRSLFEMYRKEE